MSPESSYHVLVKLVAKAGYGKKLGEAVRESAPMFAKEPGFVSHEAFALPDGNSYACLLRWKSQAASEACQNRDRTGETCLIHEMIEAGNVTMEKVNLSLLYGSEAPISAGQSVKNAINWFEIPATDFERGKKFYSAILGEKLEGTDMGGAKLAFLPNAANGVTGAVAQGPGRTPGNTGPWIFLNGDPDLSAILARVKVAGGQVLQPKTPIGPYGHIAFFKDSEGNHVGLHSQQ
jgi:predicted enzyme related to lactoylglutathione lyase